MHKHILAAGILHNEAKAFLSVEEFYFTAAFTDNLVRHSAALTATALSAIICIWSGVSFYWWGAITLISVKILITKAVALVPASATPVSVKTHSRFVFHSVR